MFGVSYQNNKSTGWFEPSFILDPNGSQNVIFRVDQEIVLNDNQVSNFKIVLKIEGQDGILVSEDIYCARGLGIRKEIINLNDKVTLSLKHQRVVDENVQKFKDTSK